MKGEEGEDEEDDDGRQQRQCSAEMKWEERVERWFSWSRSRSHGDILILFGLYSSKQGRFLEDEVDKMDGWTTQDGRQILISISSSLIMDEAVE